jgi:hypothetical protein
LFASITVPRAYRVQAVAWMGNSSTQISLPLLLEPNRPYRFPIEPWPPERTRPKTQEVRFRFWPPVAGADDTDPWTCRCGRPTGEDPSGPGHWERRVPVTFEDYDVRDSIY